MFFQFLKSFWFLAQLVIIHVDIGVGKISSSEHIPGTNQPHETEHLTDATVAIKLRMQYGRPGRQRLR